MISFFQTVKAFAEFLVQWKLKGGNLVDDNTANIRASICVACHQNRPSGEVRKKSCCGGGNAANAALSVARAMIIKNKTTSYDKQLLVCLGCGCDLKIKVWIPLEALGQTVEEVNAWPSFCWMKKIAEGKEV